MQSPEGLFFLAYLLMFLGLIGAILPVLPGAILVWLGAFVWASADGFQRVGWPTLAVLGVLTAIAWASDWIATSYTSRRAGVGWKAILAALAGGLVGSVVLAGTPPVLGSILGAILGGLAGILIIQYVEKRDWGLAFQAGKAYMIGFLASSILELFLCLLMIGIFAWQAFL